MKKIFTFNAVIGVSLSGDAFLISAPERACQFFDGSMIEDNVQSLDRYPAEPGVYDCNIEFWFEKGTNEGWDAPGESDWDFVPVQCSKIDLPPVTSQDAPHD